MKSATASILEAYGEVWARLLARLSGLGDDEYLWEPVAGCWSIHPAAADGPWLLDGDGGGGPPPDQVPVTTIAWRLGHIAGTVGGFARSRFGDGRRLTAKELPVPSQAARVEEFLDGHYRSWLEPLSGLREEQWFEPLGPAFGPFSEHTTLDLALHVFDEVVHHAAEVGVLRDLWAAGLR
ncbi:MAG: DinB family protein [Frankiales bacterium]|nr:DinB family protein [Frankiales bacterium]